MFYRQVVESWMRVVIRDGGIERFDDLHIDRIDAEWKSKKLWIPAAFQVHDVAIEIRNQSKFPVSVNLAFSLKSDSEPRGVNFGTREQFIEQLDDTPPSIYLFRPGTEPWILRTNSKSFGTSQNSLVQKITFPVFGSLAEEKNCFYLEFKEIDMDEYSRAVFISA